MRKIPLFYKILLVVIGVLVFFICASLIYLWDWLKDYQEGLPVGRMDELIKEIKAGDFNDFVSRYDFYITDFEDTENVVDYLEESFKDVKRITYKKMYSRTGERFYIYADEKAVLTVNLLKEKKGYKVSHFLLNTEIGVDIKVPKGFKVYLNDIEVSKKWVESEIGKDDAGFEYLFCMQDKEKVIEHYNVLGLLRECHVRVCDYEGNEVPLVLGDELRVSYKEVAFLVPEGSTVYINDKKVDSSFITDTVESDVEGVVLNKYTVNGIIHDIAYCVKDEKDRDMLLEVAGNTVSLKKIKYLVDAPHGYDVFVNGSKLDGKYLKETGVAVDELKYIPDKYVDKPVYDRYEVTVLGIKPEVVVKNSEGFEVVTKMGEEKAVAGFQVPKSIAKEYYPIVEERAYMHAKFVTNDLKMYQLSKVLKTDTQVYEVYKDLETQQWMYTDHIGYEFKNVKMGNLQMYNENFISCNISFDHIIIKTEKEVFTFPSSFTFYLAYLDNEWYIMDVIINSSANA